MRLLPSLEAVLLAHTTLIGAEVVSVHGELKKFSFVPEPHGRERSPRVLVLDPFH